MATKVLVLGKYYPPFRGGIEHVTKLCCEAISSECEVHAVVNSHDAMNTTEKQNDVQVTRLRPILTVFSQPLAINLPFAFRCRDYDIVHLHGPNPYAAALLAVKWVVSRRRPQIVITHHMDIFGRRVIQSLTGPFYKFLMRRASFVAVTSRKNFEISKDIPPGVRIEVVPLSIDPEAYDTSAAAKAKALKWRADHFGSASLIGFVGRHARYKGLDVLIRAIAKLPDTHLILAGDGPYKDHLERLAKEIGIAERVHFPGVVSSEEKSRILLAIDAFAFPSTEITEAFGISQLEAMIHEAPVVASNLPTGVTDVSIHDHTAYLVQPGSVDELAAALFQVASDASLAKRLAAAARLHVQTHFVDQVVSARFKELIARTAAHPRKN